MHMSTTTVNAPAPTARRNALVGWAVVSGLVVAGLVALAIALWPASEAEKARDDGEQLGQAVAQLYDAQSTADVDAALVEIRDAGQSARDHAGDAVTSQVADQEDALARTLDGFVGSRTTDDAFEADLYQAELDTAVNDLVSQADDFRSNAPEVVQSYWDGFEDGVSGR
jgi:hypothetical protein